MELTELKNRLVALFNGSEDELADLLLQFDEDKALFPFNEYEWLITTMMQQGSITYQNYLDIRNEYIARNPNLWVFEISAPRAFGEHYGQTLLQSLHPELIAPTKKIDADYHGQYDLWYEGIKIEVKASRMTDSDSKEPLYKKALSKGTTKNFLMNFQQLKPQCCDVFVWIAVYRDATTIWVMNSNEVRNHQDYSVGQHRGNAGNEGQLHITRDNIATLDQYIVTGTDLLTAIEAAARRR